MVDAGKLGLAEIDITLWLHPRKGGALSPERAIALGRTLPGNRQYLSRAELEAQHGPDPAEAKLIGELLAASYGLRTVWRRWRALRVRGTLASALQFIAEIYNAKAVRPEETGALGIVRDDASDEASLIAKAVVAVFGPAEPADPAHERSVKQPSAAADNAATASAATAPISPQALARHYNLPPGLDGSGQTLGIIEFGGTFDRKDFEASMAAAGVTPGDVTIEEIDPIDPAEFNDEVTIDTQVAGAFAPGAKIKLYFAENTKRGWLEALVSAVADGDAAPSIVSMSYGQPESFFSVAEIACFEEIFVAAALLGTTVIVSSGDSGPGYGAKDGTLAVSYPASSRFVLACGGTELLGNDGRITGERVWNAGSDKATGGGFSVRSELAAWQRGPLHAALGRYRKLYGTAQGRGTPDLVAMAAPGHPIVRGGVKAPGGGTSAVAPFIAALVARINQRLDGTPAGFFTPLLYEHGEAGQAFREIRRGDLPPFRPSGGWDPSVGLGAPKGSELLLLLTRGAS